MEEQERQRLYDMYSNKTPYITASGFLSELELAIFSGFVNQITGNNAVLFLNCIIHQSNQGARERLIDTLVMQAEYETVKGSIDQSDIFAPLAAISSLSKYIRNSHEVIEGVSNLWEVTAQLIRSLYQLPIPMRTNLWNVLRHVHNDARFADLIRHTEFSVDRSGGGRYRNGSILHRLKCYRNLTAHTLGIEAEAISSELDRLGNYAARGLVQVYDHLRGASVTITIPSPQELLQLAEDSYRHYVQGYEIIESGMRRHLGLPT